MKLRNDVSDMPSGPLQGLRVVELAGIGPAPFGVMLLADLGADVTRIDKYAAHAGNPLDPRLDILTRGRRSIQLNLKEEEDRALALELIAAADVLVEGYRPGVAERLGLGPAACLELNPQLVYGRMTGWGQSGPLAQRAGHDINYISVAGALAAIGPVDGPPVIPSNFLGDFGGGGMLLALGVMAAVHHARESGEGQVVDTSILDGTVLLTTMQHAFRAQGLLQSERGDNMLDGGAHFYQVYETADGRYLSVGAIEPQFYKEFVQGLGEVLEGDWASSHTDRHQWPGMIKRVESIIRSRPLDDWMRVFDGTDACVTPVLTLEDAMEHPQNVARRNFTTVAGLTQPSPAPRFNMTPPRTPSAPVQPGEHSAQIREELGLRRS